MSTMFDTAQYHIRVAKEKIQRIKDIEHALLFDPMPDYVMAMYRTELQMVKKDRAKHVRLAKRFGGTV